MQLTLNLTKEGESTQKLQLNLKKNEQFKVLLGWEGKTDLDLHALRCTNFGSGAKLSSFDEILSTYNVKRKIGSNIVGTLDRNPDGGFSTLNKALQHSPDVTEGDANEIDEFIIIDPSLMEVPNGAFFEIPLIAMIHPQNDTCRFKDVANAWVSIEDSDGKEVMKASLSSQFGEFVGVQMGSIVIDSSGTHFETVGSGFNVDFNGVLGCFS